MNCLLNEICRYTKTLLNVCRESMAFHCCDSPMIILFRNVRYSSNYDLQMKTQDVLNDLQVGIISATPQIETV